MGQVYRPIFLHRQKPGPPLARNVLYCRQPKGAKMITPRVLYQFSLPLEILQRLNALAKTRTCSAASIARAALIEYLDKNAPQTAQAAPESTIPSRQDS